MLRRDYALLAASFGALSMLVEAPALARDQPFTDSLNESGEYVAVERAVPGASLGRGDVRSPLRELPRTRGKQYVPMMIFPYSPREGSEHIGGWPLA